VGAANSQLCSVSCHFLKAVLKSSVIYDEAHRRSIMQLSAWKDSLSQPLPVSQSLVSLKRLTNGIGILKEFSAYIK